MIPKTTLIILIIYLLTPLGLQADSNGITPAAPAEVLSAARAGLPKILDSIRSADPAHYGFQSVEDFSRIEIGTVYQVATVPVATLDRLDLAQHPFGSYLTLLPLWYLPLSVRNQVNSLLIVTQNREKNGYRVAEIGHTLIARPLGFMPSQVARLLKNANLHLKTAARLVRLFHLNDLFLLIDTDQGEYAYPVRSLQPKHQVEALIPIGTYLADLGFSPGKAAIPK
jgi:hypothetical protein